MKLSELRERLDTALDERRDPLDDPEILAALERDDEALLELAAWRESERGLELPTAAFPRGPLAAPRRHVSPRRVLAATALLAGAAWLAFPSGPAPLQTNPEIPAVPAAPLPTPRCEVLSFRASIEVVSERGTSRWSQDGFGDRGVSRAAQEHRVSLAASTSSRDPSTGVVR